MGEFFYKDTEDFEVFASWPTREVEGQQSVGSIELEVDNDGNCEASMMPGELEINGYTYTLEV